MEDISRKDLLVQKGSQTARIYDACDVAVLGVVGRYFGTFEMEKRLVFRLVRLLSAMLQNFGFNYFSRSP